VSEASCWLGQGLSANKERAGKDKREVCMKQGTNGEANAFQPPAERSSHNYPQDRERTGLYYYHPPQQPPTPEVCGTREV
jgi:hypothetical protein